MSSEWRHISQSVPGAAHTAQGEACQDACRVVVLHHKAPETLIACVADGAGSATHGGIGSSIACNAIVECIDAYMEAQGTLAGVAAHDAIAWCELVRQRIDSEATTCGVRFEQFATTLCAAILTPEGACCMQLGDGAIVLGKQGIWGVAFWPQSGEYANTTNFVTSHEYRERMQFFSSGERFTDVALFTDGIERLALRFDSRTPHLPFFEPLFQALRTQEHWQRLVRGLQEFLNSAAVASRSNDDKTLVLATWADG